MTSLSETSILAGTSGASTGYTIKNSIRFNDDDTAYMSKTISSTSSRTTWTFSTWFKLGNSGINVSFGGLFSAVNNASNYINFGLSKSTYGIDYLVYNSGSTLGRINTDRLFRDPSAWYHLVGVLDTTNDISSERMRLYINGERETSFYQESYPSKDATPIVNLSGVTHNLGRAYNAGTYSGYYYDGYMAETHFVDGYAYEPSYFGEFQEDTDIWIPKKYSGSYGTNGFYIKGSDSSSLGTDSSGNGNNYTTSGLQANDQKTDTPTNNMITFNPLNNQRSGGTLSNGNLDYVGPGTRTLISLTANIPSTGKWAIAYKVAQVSTGSGWQIGISTASDPDFGDAAGSNEDIDLVRSQPTSSDLEIGDAVNSSSIDPSLPITTSDEFWVAVDMDSGNVYLGIYDASDTSMKFVANDAGLDGNPATGDNPTVTFTTAQMPRDDVVFSVGSKQTSQYIYLQRSTDVSGTTPTGYTYFENVKDLI